MVFIVQINGATSADRVLEDGRAASSTLQEVIDREGIPWFLPAIGSWYRLRDNVDRLFVG